MVTLTWDRIFSDTELCLTNLFKISHQIPEVPSVKANKRLQLLSLKCTRLGLAQVSSSSQSSNLPTPYQAIVSCSFNSSKLSEFSGSNVYFFKQKEWDHALNLITVNRLSCVSMEKKLISPLSLTKIFRCSSLSLKPSIFSLLFNYNHCFFGSLQFPVQKKATIIWLQTHPALKMRNLSPFHCQPAQLFFQFSKKAFCFAQLHKGGWIRVGRQPILSLKSSPSICSKTPLGLQTPLHRAVKGLRTDWKCLQKWGMELAGVEGVMRGASICFL